MGNGMEDRFAEKYDKTEKSGSPVEERDPATNVLLRSFQYGITLGVVLTLIAGICVMIQGTAGNSVRGALIVLAGALLFTVLQIVLYARQLKKGKPKDL